MSSPTVVPNSTSVPSLTSLNRRGRARTLAEPGLLGVRNEVRPAVVAAARSGTQTVVPLRLLSRPGASARRDEGAFEQLVRRHTAALYHGALRTTGSPQLAEEVVQDAWLSAWLHVGGFRGQSAVRTWLVRIVTSKALNALRRPQRTLALDAVPEVLAAGDSDPEQQAELRERARAVRLAVAALPERQREAVVLRDLEGLSYEEVARALDCSVASVKSALHRGRRALAEALDQYRPEAAAETPLPATSGPGSPPQRPAATALRTQTGPHHD